MVNLQPPPATKKPLKTKRCEKYGLIIAKNNYMHQLFGNVGKIDLTSMSKIGKIQLYRGHYDQGVGVP